MNSHQDGQEETDGGEEYRTQQRRFRRRLHAELLHLRRQEDGYRKRVRPNRIQHDVLAMAMLS